MNKSLTPLIIFFSFIILFTVVIVHSYSKKKIVNYEEDELTPSMALSPFQEMRLRRRRKNRRMKEKFDIDSAKMLREARQDLANSKGEAAEDKLRTLLLFEPNNYPALSLLGGIFYHTSRYKAAEELFRKQIKVDPENSSGYSNLGTALAKQQKFEEAINTTSQALKKEPSSSAAHINLASMYCAIGNTDKAILHFKEAYDLLGHRIIPLSYDTAFKKLRSHPEFQQVLQQAEKELKRFQEQQKMLRENTADTTNINEK